MAPKDDKPTEDESKASEDKKESTVKSEDKKDSKAESKNESKNESKSESKNESKSEDKKESKAEDKKESKSEDKKSSTSSSSSSSKRKGKVDMSSAKFGFIGAGKTADAIIRGLITYAKVEPSRIHVAAKTSKNLEQMKAKGCHITKRSYDIFAKYDCDVVFLCFHGSVIKECYKMGGSRPHPLTTNFIPNMKHPLYVLSLVSGVKLDQIRACLLNPEHPDKYMIEMHRLSISTAVAYGLGVTAIDVEPDSKKCSPLVKEVLSSISKVDYIPESQMDSACALAGNGLAFVYYFMNALADGAFKMGLPKPLAVKFAAKTMQCAAQTLLESGKHPSELKDSCISASGPGIYGIHVLDKADVASGVAGAVEAAHKRAKELAEQVPE